MQDESIEDLFLALDTDFSGHAPAIRGHRETRTCVSVCRGTVSFAEFVKGRLPSSCIVFSSLCSIGIVGCAARVDA